MNYLNFSITFLLVTSLFWGCGSGNPSSGEQAPESSSAEMAMVSQQTNASPVQSQLDQAKNAGQAAFLIVHDGNSTGLQELETKAQEAVNKDGNAVVVKMDRSNNANAQLVNQYQLTNAPMPLVLVFSRGGVPVGGMVAAQVTPESLLSAIPSPNLDKVYESIGNGKPVFVVFTKSSMSDRNEVIKACNSAVAQLNNGAEIVEVDITDPKEELFISQFRINPEATASSTIVINAQGQVSGTSLSTVPDADRLAEAALAQVAAGCGPGAGPMGCAR